MYYYFKVLLTIFFLYIYTIMKIQNKNIIASILFILISFVCQAQGINPPPPTPPPPGLTMPIDDGVLVVLCLGLAYGLRRLLQKKNRVIDL